MSDEQNDPVVPRSVCIVCKKTATTRGLCPKCYGTASALVKAGKSTWEALAAAGLALPSKRVSAGPSAFAVAFATVGSPSGEPKGEVSA